MKTKIKIITAAIFAFSTLGAMAQELPAPPAGNELAQAGPPRGPGRRPGQGRDRGDQLRELTAFKGTVVNYTANDHFEYDGFVFKSGSTTYNVKFPAPLAQELMKAATKGNTVTINGAANQSPEGENNLRMVTLEAGGKTIANARMPRRPDSDDNLVSKTYSGTIRELTRNRDSVVNGIIISNNYLIGLPPHVAEQLGTVLKAGQQVEVFGFERPKRDGVVMSRKVQAIDIQTLKINGKTYLVR